MTRATAQSSRAFAEARAMGKRIRNAIGAGLSRLMAELRHLNAIGANESSHADRVRAVKRSLARHGEGPRRCC
jgi:hypothetical protein